MFVEKVIYEKIDRHYLQFVKILRIELERNRLTVPRHWHKSIEIIYPQGGDADIFMNGAFSRIGRKGFFVINSKTIHAFQGNGAPYRGYAIQLDLNYIRSLYPDIDSVKFVNSYDGILEKEILEVLDRMVSVPESDHKEMVVNGYAAVLVGKLLNGEVIREDYRNIKSSPHYRQISDIMSDIENRYYEKLSIGEIAEKFNLSYGYLARLFKDCTGITLKEYINIQRLDHALLDMECSSLSLMQIAMKNGFSDYKSFVALFKERFSLRPSQYRNKLDISL